MYSDEMLKEILLSAKVVACVGLSTNPQKVSYGVAQYLMEHGYHVIPVNPMAEQILGEKAYPDLSSIPDKIDVVQVFRRPEDVPPIAEEAVKVGAKVVWMQVGIVNEQAADTVRAAGLQVVMDTCMRATHQRLIE